MITDDKMFAVEDNRDAADALQGYLEGKLRMKDVEEAFNYDISAMIEKICTTPGAAERYYQEEVNPEMFNESEDLGDDWMEGYSFEVGV